MTSPIVSTATSSPVKGIISFRRTQMCGETWPGGDVQDSHRDSEAQSLRLKVDVDIQSVYRKAGNVLRFVIDSRVAIVRKDGSSGVRHALTDRRRGELLSQLRDFVRIKGDPEQMKVKPSWPAYLLDDVRQHGSTEGIVRDLRCLLWLGAFSRVASIDLSQCHGLKTL